MTKTKEEQQAYFDAQTKLYKAQRKQQDAKVGSKQEAEGRQEQQEALSVLSDLEYREGHREEFEPKVTLSTPSGQGDFVDSVTGLEFVGGKAQAPRSLATRLTELGYTIEESA
jgi:hypothetical protein